MSTYRKRTQAKPTTAAGLRAQASANGSSIFGNRPRSIAGLLSPNQSSYSSLIGSSPTNSSYLPSLLNKSRKNPRSFFKNSYSNSVNNLNYQNSYTTYGGTASGYGGLTLPAAQSSVSSLNIAVPSASYNRSSAHRAESFNRSKTKAASTLSFGSRSSSLQSLAGSEGYIVRVCVCVCVCVWEREREQLSVFPIDLIWFCTRRAAPNDREDPADSARWHPWRRRQYRRRCRQRPQEQNPSPRRTVSSITRSFGKSLRPRTRDSGKSCADPINNWRKREACSTRHSSLRTNHLCPRRRNARGEPWNENFPRWRKNSRYIFLHFSFLLFSLPFRRRDYIYTQSDESNYSDSDFFSVLRMPNLCATTFT